jgi:uncharacterized membrane protein
MDDNGSIMHGASPFRAVLHPHRSLDPRGFLILMLALGTVSFATGLIFLSIGAWPVMGFFGLDVLLVYVAFKLNYRAARAYELVELTPVALKLTQVNPSGRSREFEFNPYWVRVRFIEHPDGSNNLRLTSHGRELEFARLLNDDERRDFARVLEGALATARTSPGA